MEQQIAGHLSLDPPKPTSLKPDLPAGLDGVIARDMAKKPEKRYQTTTELAAAARQARSPDTAGRTTPNYRRRHAAGRARAPGEARRCHPHRNPSAGRKHRCTGFADTRSDRHFAAFAGESSADPTPSPSAAPQNHRGRHGVDHRIPIDRTVERIVLSIVQPIAVPIVPPDHPALHPPRRARRFGGEHCRRRLRRRSRQQPDDETRSALQHSDHDAVYWPQGPSSVAVDAAGDVYVIDIPADSRVSKLAAGAVFQTALPFTGLNSPSGVAVGASGDVYIADTWNSRVLKLAAGASTQTVLPFVGLSYPEDVAADGAGGVFVATPATTG